MNNKELAHSLVEGKYKRVQYFSFYIDKFDASNIENKDISLSAFDDWDFALVDDNGVETAYTSRTASNWVSTKEGDNNWGLKFMSEGRHNYDEYPEYKHLGR